MTPSSVDLQSEDDNALPDIEVPTEPTRNVNIDTHNVTSTPNKKSSLSAAEVTSSSKDRQVLQERKLEDSSNMLSNDVPLKQRLRSATQHKSDTSSGSTSGI
jgi:predicted nucleotidyltransferase